jgi:hypothetical protein
MSALVILNAKQSGMLFQKPVIEFIINSAAVMFLQILERSMKNVVGCQVLHTCYSGTDCTSHHNVLEIFTISECKEAKGSSQPDGTPPLYQEYC